MWYCIERLASVAVQAFDRRVGLAGHVAEAVVDQVVDDRRGAEHFVVFGDIPDCTQVVGEYPVEVGRRVRMK